MTMATLGTNGKCIRHEVSGRLTVITWLSLEKGAPASARREHRAHEQLPVIRQAAAPIAADTLALLITRPRRQPLPSAASPSTASSSAVRLLTSPGWKISPFPACTTSSGFPPTFDASTVQPQAIASISEFENDSLIDGSTKTSMRRYHEVTSTAAAVKVVRSRTPRRRASA